MDEMTPTRDEAPRDGGVGWAERGLGWAAVAAFVVFALWSGWAFLTYQHGPEARYFLDPAAHPNSILVQATLGEYLETFDPWRGWDAVPLRAISLWLAVLAGLWLLADGVTRPAGRRDLRPLTFALLLGAAGSLIATFRLAGWDSLGVVGVLAALLMALVGVRLLRGQWRPHRTLGHALRPLRRPRGAVVVAALVGLLLLLAALSAATPETNRDPLRYHLAAPQVWLDRGGLDSIEGMAFSHFPFLIEMWFLVGLALEGERLARLFHFLFFLVSLGLVAAMTRRLARWAALPTRLRAPLPTLAVALAATIPAFTITATWGNIDAGVVCFHLAALLALALWWRTGATAHLMLAAALAGFLLGTKYTAVVPVAVLGVGVLMRHQPCTMRRVGSVLTFGLIALAVASVWPARNGIQTGNPVYPLAHEIFPAAGWDAEAQTLWETKAAQKGVEKIWTNLLAAWRGATFQWAGGEDVGPGGFEEQSIGFAPWLLMPLGLAGLLLLAVRRGGWWWFYLLFIGANGALWFFTYQSNRLLLATLLTALPGAVVGLAWLTQRWRPMWIAAVTALGIACAYQGAWIARYFLLETCPLQLTLGFWEADEWRAARLSGFDGARAVRALVPEDERALVIGEAQRFHFPPNVVMSDWYDPPAVRRYLSPSFGLRRVTWALTVEGVTHVLINHAELAPLWLAWPETLRADGTVDPAAYWGAWSARDAAIPPTSNLALFRERFTDAQASLLAEWLATVPHRVIWRSDQWPGVELWRLTPDAAGASE